MQRQRDRDRPRRRSGRRRRAPPRARRRARCRRRPGSRGRPAGRSPRASALDELAARGAAASEPDGSWSSTRAAPSSGSLRACSTSALGLARVPGAVDEPGVELARRRAAIASPASRRFETSFSGSCSRKTSMPFSAARGDEAARRSRRRRAASRRGSGRAAPSRAASSVRAFERADPLPRALDAAAHGRVEDAAAGDLEVGEAGAVEDLREPQELGRRHRARRAAPGRAGGSSCRRARHGRRA